MKKDQEIFDLIQKESKRQKNGIEGLKSSPSDFIKNSLSNSKGE